MPSGANYSSGASPLQALEHHITRHSPAQDAHKNIHKHMRTCTYTAFGDASLKGKGLCVDPDVSQHHIVAGDEFVVVASDGLYDVLTSQQVVDFVTAQTTSNPNTKLNTIAKRLTTRAIKNGSLDNTTVGAASHTSVCIFSPAPD